MVVVVVGAVVAAVAAAVEGSCEFVGCEKDGTPSGLLRRTQRSLSGHPEKARRVLLEWCPWPWPSTRRARRQEPLECDLQPACGFEPTSQKRLPRPNSGSLGGCPEGHVEQLREMAVLLQPGTQKAAGTRTTSPGGEHAAKNGAAATLKMVIHVPVHLRLLAVAAVAKPGKQSE